MALTAILIFVFLLAADSPGEGILYVLAALIAGFLGLATFGA